MPIRECETCGGEFNARPDRMRKGQGRWCSQACWHAVVGRKRFIRSDGYASVKRDGKWVLEHRVIMERILGRPLERGEQVHHRNEDRADNREENLELVTVSGHISDHHPCKRQPDKWARYKCAECGTYFQRTRSAANCKGQQRNFCGRPCFHSWLRKRMATLRGTGRKRSDPYS